MLTLYPTSYSNTPTIDGIKRKLALDPKQQCNTPAAYKGLVMEFCTDPGSPVGTLDEFYQHDHEITFTIVDVDRARLHIVRRLDGDFIIAPKLPVSEPKGLQQSIFLSNLHHTFAQTDGSYKYPNSREGDMLKQAKKELEAALKINSQEPKGLKKDNTL
jgi:hypothetical protein